MTDSPPPPEPRVQFLSFAGCPLAEQTRTRLEAALEEAGLSHDAYRVVDVLDPQTPASLARWGSPTILIDGKDFAGAPAGSAPACRVYDTPDKLPDLQSLVQALKARAAN